MKNGPRLFILLLVLTTACLQAICAESVKVLNRDASVIVFSDTKEDSILLMKSVDRAREIFTRLFPNLGNALEDNPIVVYAKNYTKEQVEYFKLAFIMGITRPGARLDIRINGPVPALYTGVIRIMFAMRLSKQNNTANALAQKFPQWLISAVWHHYQLTYQHLVPKTTNIVFKDALEFRHFLDSPQKRPFENSQQAYFFLKFLFKNYLSTPTEQDEFFTRLTQILLESKPASDVFAQMNIDINSLIFEYNRQYEQDTTIIPSGTNLDKLDTIWKLYKIFHYRLSPLTPEKNPGLAPKWYYYADEPDIKRCCKNVLAKHIVTNTYTRLLKLKPVADPQAARFIDLYLSCVYTKNRIEFKKLFKKAEKMRRSYCQIRPDEINVLRAVKN